PSHQHPSPTRRSSDLGKSADPEHAYKTMRLIRRIVGEMIGAGAARKVRILYGGSVNAANVQSYVELPYCDGCLVGGASLDASELDRKSTRLNSSHVAI